MSRYTAVPKKPFIQSCEWVQDRIDVQTGVIIDTSKQGDESCTQHTSTATAFEDAMPPMTADGQGARWMAKLRGAAEGGVGGADMLYDVKW